MKNKGFTLFELLITISIIGILTAIATISFSSAQKKGRDARRIQDMKNIQTAAEQYYSMNNSLYPPAATGAGFSGPLVGVGGTGGLIQSWPIDPKGSGVGVTQYSVFGINNGIDYCVCAKMENSALGNSATIQCPAFTTSGIYYCVKNQQ